MITIPEMDTEQYIKEVCKFIQEKVEQSHTKGVVLGLSGGIDSTIVAYLSVLALGKDHVKGYILPSKTTSKEDLNDALLIKDLLNIQAETIYIDDIYDSFLQTDGTDVDDKTLAQSNIKPRIRMTLLYYYATLNNYLVIGTGNKTELNIGYFTKYGDGGVDLSPIGDLYKEEVKQVAYKLNVPENIINKSPTAGLTLNQTDESDLGLKYSQIDKIVYAYTEKSMKTMDISKQLGIEHDKVESIINRIISSQHKRELAPIFKKK
ncbi:MAG: NAD(+) synthetase [Methanosphaera sp. rholeuAM74]|nr:MAG: NAD(+) synthetase [Methanosphaera sp. rholeuAM74]